MMKRARNLNGYSLVELLVVVIILAVLTTVGMRSMSTVVDTGRIETTKLRLDRLAVAIVGDPAKVANGTRSDYGYVGDVGALPANLDALLTNPGLGTWRGPYIRDDLTAGGAHTEFKKDGWGNSLSYSAGVSISANSGGTTITKTLAPAVSDLLYNQVIVTVTDLDHGSPGATYKDSIRFILTVPNGAGGTTNKIKYPAADGYLRYDSIPIGLHALQAIYLPNADTIRQYIAVEPGENSTTHVQLFREVW